MSASTWGGTDLLAEENYPLPLLKLLLKQMMMRFGADGACMALYDEAIGQMRVRVHTRLKRARAAAANSSSVGSEQAPYPTETARRRATVKLNMDDEETWEVTAISPASHHPRSQSAATDDIVDVSPQQCELFVPGSTYAQSQDLIGSCWHNNEAFVMRHDNYMKHFRADQSTPPHCDVTPAYYLVVPIRESTLVDEACGEPRPAAMLGVVVLYYYVEPIGVTPVYVQKQRAEALNYSERIALALQNCTLRLQDERLRRKQRRTSEYLQLLQNISSVFPTSVKLSDLVENIYHFVSRVVDVSGMLLTLYDRDLDRLYDIFAISHGQRVEGLAEKPTVRLKTERPVWWHETQHEKRKLLFSPANDTEKAHIYQELLTGVWGDQRHTRSFLLLPMKMFNRVIGTICLTSMQSNAYQHEEIQVLETMVQIVTVSIENTKLYERDRAILNDARQREAQLAAINSALQSISSVLNVTELLNNLVESVAAITKVELCVFFEPSASSEELIAHALYAPSSVQMVDDGSGMPIITPPKKGEPDKLISLIQLPFKGTFLEHMADEGFFYLDPPKLEELARSSNDGGKIFLGEMGIEHILMVPMSYQTEFIGFLAVPTPSGNRFFRPKDVGTVLAICAQAASAIRNAQLFEQREEAYARLERMDKLKDEFLVTASHELRTPLTAISGYSSQLKRQSARATSQTVLRFATKISVAAQQLSDLVASITEAAQIGPGDRKMDLHIEAVQVLAAAEVAVNMLTHNSEHMISLNIDPQLWINGDAPRVRQVLTNLLENATKYSPPGTMIQVTATSLLLSEVEPLLSDDQADPTLLLDNEDISVILVRVKDKGEGILAADQQKIFEKFVRAPRSLTTPVRGSGLGLYICRRFVEAMNGKLWLEQSIANEGSTFSFYLPQVSSPVDTVE
ncbi:sensor histidine kinase [Dictyobacter formicarum]|uniref:histidine kinase n=1 Tax=Dictyobacter formicarum TaxID=2778368 RepID=A0ABQ3VKB9_9CHLR|nr:GAF domain-containing sensor histidine kinase [Dictyobacter formicarum]GHO85561.1 hypothetical protein KSZ_35670 [Dictyobacter formicarum]